MLPGQNAVEQWHDRACRARWKKSGTGTIGRLRPAGVWLHSPQADDF
jgi:hypothetical protein